MSACILHHRPSTASALAGRPLRFIGPGFPGGVVVAGYSGNPQWDPENCAQTCLQSSADRSAYAILETDKVLKDERMYFDLHLHYKSVVWAIGDGQNTGVVEMVLDDSNSPWAGHAPEAAVALEWGPKADKEHDWWKGENGYYQNGAEFDNYLNEGVNDPARAWEDFINEDNSNLDPGWEYAQYGQQTDGDGFRMYDILDDLFDRGYLVACYGPTGQKTSRATTLNIAALLGSLISTNVQTPSDSYIRDDNRWTPLRGYYENSAGDHQIALSKFKPHAEACDLSKACPDE